MEFFPQVIDYERSVATAQAYTKELRDHIDTIPDVSSLPVWVSFSDEQKRQIGLYCQSGAYKHTLSAQRELPVPPLYRDDIIEPDWSQSVSKLSCRAAGSESEHHHWYQAFGAARGRFDYGDPRRDYASRQWELAYIGYVRQRRTFHADFMAAVLEARDIDQEIAALQATPENPHLVPATTLDKSGKEPAPDFMYNTTNWLVSSLLSTLALPPDICSPAMKHHAVKLFAKYADLNDLDAFENFYDLSRPQTQRLPWSMRNAVELRADRQPNWKSNSTITELLQPAGRPSATGMLTLLHERPKDYVQVVILHLFQEPPIFKNELARQLANLVEVTKLSPEAQAVIFSEDAAFNTVYGPPTLPGLDEPQTLIEYLERSNDATESDWKQIALEQRVAMQGLRLELEQAKKAQADAEARITELRAQKLGGTALSPFEKYGISPHIPDELLPTVVDAIRRKYNKELRSDSGHVAHGSMSAAEIERNTKRLQTINAELDEILRSRGLQRNRG